ncbi:response regulator transcription factor [Enterococcus casseliflavus]|uniref:response regulator transcription factor n=1 Tax=Enterococcus casseliflavus TaxID=37734 RepID=UPI001433401E|nr:response regulator transcription factor [Enterococcus casseliflavus]NKD34134.1 response regulator transcription factor [Enterococcus casseliflavus]
MITILIVEDELDLRIILEDYLHNSGYQVRSADSAMTALTYLEKETFDLIICDVMMPQIDGFAFLTMIRDAKIETPFIFLTAKGQIEDKKAGFVSGADDYLVKPFEYEELILRMKAILKRYQITEEQQIYLQNMHLDATAYTLQIDEQLYHLPKKEFEVLWLLASQANTIFTRQDILIKIWDYDSESTERTVDVHINRLRKKLIDAQVSIKTVHGLGYLLEETGESK